ncbi:hypothetical protein [Plebeiibacterium marinum]|uniref:Uncharacterized protein n=1 Tax=Plebeiibacterium marinum TaxID=2992111 RepID=A0AAE3SLS8_9BACT|nr:hypothetical protein [Plebeiobacterium marinum]MCW3807789.1 hypothetical protein [Plebeiobacterium marinum]
MKDQKVILHKCIKNDEPAFVIAGHDVSAVETLKAYYDVAKKNGADEIFLKDMQDVIQEFELFRKQEPQKIKMPVLKDYEH